MEKQDKAGESSPVAEFLVLESRVRQVKFHGASQKDLALCVSVLTRIEREVRKARNEVLKAMVVGASQGALPV